MPANDLPFLGKFGCPPVSEQELRRRGDHVISEMEKAMAASLRCKVRVHAVTRNIDAEGKVESETVNLCAVYSSDPKSENAQWSKWTPSAQFSLTINNPDAFGKLSKDHEFYIDFIPASK